MSNFKKVLAVTAGAALGMSTLAAVPANAAANNGELTLSDGANYSLFNEDTFNLDVTQPAFVTDAIANANFALVIQNPDSVDLDIDFEGVGADYNMSVIMVDANGDATAGAGAVNAAAENTAETLDFATGDAVTAILHTFQDGDGGDAAIAPTKVEIARIAADDDHGDDGASISMFTFLDVNSDFTDIEMDAASETLTLTWVDPATVSVITKLQRVVADTGNLFNVPAAENITGTVRFSNPNINLDQTDITNWDWDVFTDGAAVVADADVTPIVSSFFDGNDEHDDAGSIVAQFPVNADLEVDHTYQIKVSYDGNARLFTSAGFEVVSSDSLADAATIEIDETANIADDDANGITLRTGTTSATWTITADVADANIPVVIYATSTNEAVITLTGASGTAEEGQAVSYTTLTNSDGEVEVTVNSSTAANGDVYTLDAVIIEDDGTTAAVAQQTVTYADAVDTSWETNSTVLSGETLTLTATVSDQFGEGISLDGTKVISVGVTATDSDDLELFAPLVDGVATFTFDNFLAEGGSDVLTVNAYTGANDDQTAVAGLNDITVTLYAQYDVEAVNLTSAEVDATVVYVDFADDLDTAPAGASKGTINGTVIDATGAGVPGAQVTLTSSAAGLLFEDAAGDFGVDSITVSAGEAGTFAVDVWTHIAADVDVTVASAGKSSTVVVAGALPTADDSIDASDLVFSWNLEEVVLVNKTYAVTATLTDIWGNGIENADVTFTGEAAAQFNSDATVTKSTNSSGNATAYLRSLEDVTGLAAVSVSVADDIDIDGANNAEISTIGNTFTDDENTSWDETAFSELIEEEINFLATAPAAASDTKVNAGSFKGYVAVYAKGYEGQRLSAKIGNDWVIVPSLASNFERIVDFTGAGVDIAVRIYIDRVLMDTINLTTK